MSWSDNRAVLRLMPAGMAEIDREAATTTLHLPHPYDAAALLHPHLGTTAVSVAAWAGRCSLHAGSFVHDGGVWAVLGEREDGKSSTLAWLIRAGIGVVADDLLVTDGHTVLAGPRFVDLREGAAQRFGLGSDIGVIGTRRRWRVPLPPIEAELPLRGWIELGWGPLGVDRIPVAERLDVLTRHRGLKLPLDDRPALLATLGRPALRFRRPKDWTVLDDAMALLLASL